MAITLPPSGDATGEIRETVESVLSRSEFASAEPSLVDRALAWLGEQVSRFAGLVVGNDVGQTLFSVVLAVAALGLVVATVLFARRLRRDRTPRASAVVAAGGVSAAEWAARAAAASDSGNLREAVRCRYRALVADLAARGVVDDVPGRTAGQYLEVVRAAVPPAAAPFARATTGFERAWYGHATVTTDDDAAMVAAVTATREQIRTHRGAGGAADRGSGAPPARVGA